MNSELLNLRLTRPEQLQGMQQAWLLVFDEEPTEEPESEPCLSRHIRKGLTYAITDEYLAMFFCSDDKSPITTMVLHRILWSYLQSHGAESHIVELYGQESYARKRMAELQEYANVIRTMRYSRKREQEAAAAAAAANNPVPPLSNVVGGISNTLTGPGNFVIASRGKSNLVVATNSNGTADLHLPLTPAALKKTLEAVGIDIDLLPRK